MDKRQAANKPVSWGGGDPAGKPPSNSDFSLKALRNELMREKIKPLRWLLPAFIFVFALQGCATPGQRGASTGAAMGGGIALLAGASPWGVLGGALLGGGVGYAVGNNTGLFR